MTPALRTAGFPQAPWHGPLLDRRHLLRVSADPMLRHDAGQLPFQSAQVLLLCHPEDDNVIEINEAGLPRQPPQRCLHQALKRRWGVAQSERHDAELEEPQGVENAVFSRSLSATSTCQYLDAKLSVRNHLAPASAFNVTLRRFVCVSLRRALRAFRLR
ncbi:hypothetical protein T08_9261 [Trichinella sp. T8]|nr:hypothetical protein T08_9261 [Trichinella sp. T8]